jgi:hypothetical protein
MYVDGIFVEAPRFEADVPVYEILQLLVHVLRVYFAACKMSSKSLFPVVFLPTRWGQLRAYLSLRCRL